MKILILGLGNELYGDDAVGIHVVRELRQHPRVKEMIFEGGLELDCEECSLSGLALLEIIAGYDRLLIIDTIKSPNPETGKIHLIDSKNLRNIPGPSPHYVSIPQTIEIGKNLGLKMPSEIKIIAVEAKNLYNLGEKLSEEMKKSIPSIVQKVIETLHSLKR